jgi:hypothetical protein
VVQMEACAPVWAVFVLLIAPAAIRGQSTSCAQILSSLTGRLLRMIQARSMERYQGGQLGGGTVGPRGRGRRARTVAAVLQHAPGSGNTRHGGFCTAPGRIGWQ